MGGRSQTTYSGAPAPASPAPIAEPVQGSFYQPQAMSPPSPMTPTVMPPMCGPQIQPAVNNQQQVGAMPPTIPAPAAPAVMPSSPGLLPMPTATPAVQPTAQTAVQPARATATAVNGVTGSLASPAVATTGYSIR